MRFVFTTLLLVVLILLAVAIAILLLSLGFVGMGWLLSRLLPLSLFEASVIALLSGFGLAHVISQIVSIPTGSAYDEDWEDEEDWDEEDWEEDEYEEPISFPQWRRRGGEVQKSTDVPVVGHNDPCPCGSGKKYKYCHGKKK